jgi:hypothetical protein
MKIKDVIKNMQDYNPEDEVVILWWTKDIFDDNEEKVIDNDAWSNVVKILDDGNRLDFGTEMVYDSILDELIEQGIRDGYDI